MRRGFDLAKLPKQMRRESIAHTGAELTLAAAPRRWSDSRGGGLSSFWASMVESSLLAREPPSVVSLRLGVR